MGAEPLTPGRPIWLWPASAGLRLWTPDETHLYADVAHEDPVRLRRATRDGRTQYRLDKVLRPPALAQHLADLLRAPGPRPLIHLANGPDRDLPLQDLPFESLWLDGRTLGEIATFCRHVRLDTAPTPPAPMVDLIIADLWPKPPPGKSRPLAGLLDRLGPIGGGVRILAGPQTAEAYLRSMDPANYAALVVFCHGSEDEHPATPPLLGPSGQPWALPLNNGLPPLVVLLACGSDSGNLVRHGRSLLAHGARALIAPFGRLDADAARSFLDRFLPRWLAGGRLDAALQATQAQDKTGWGARRLVLVGAPGLRRAVHPRLEEIQDAELAAIVHRDDQRAALALLCLVERYTLRGFQQGHGLRNAEPTLRDTLSVAVGDEGAERWLFAHLDQAVRLGRIGLMTQAWLYPWLAQSAERFHHERMDHYAAAWRKLGEATTRAPASIHHYWHRTAYRHGRYGEALEELIKGLDALGPEEFWPEGAPLARDLANLLIEFNVPKAAQQVASALQTHLGTGNAGGALQAERHKLMDTLARAHLRGGGEGWRSALALLLRKRADARQLYGEQGHRELAALLHLISWADPASALAQELAREARLLLAKVDETLATIHIDQGNSTSLYLLRAFAAWVWRTGNPADADLLGRYRSLWERDLYTRRDPGPLGCICAYLNLYAQEGGYVPSQDLPSWPAGRELLSAECYYLDAAILDALLGHGPKAQAHLARFHRQGETLPQALSRLAGQRQGLAPLDLGSVDLADWAQEIAGRRHLESQILAKHHRLTPATLLACGIMPL